MRLKTFIILILMLINNQLVNATNCPEADEFLKKAYSTSDEEEKFEFLHLAKDTYLECYKYLPSDTSILTGISKVNQMLGNRQEAKLYVLKAYNLNPANADLQKEMGDFYYNFQEYSTAIEYYKLSLASGNLKDYKTNLQTAKCYDKLADLENAELYYKICNYLNPTSEIASKKLAEINKIKNSEQEKELEKIREEEEKQRLNKEADEIIKKIQF